MIEKEDLRIVFYGTPSFAVPTLEKLIEEKFNVVLVVTSPGETPVKNVADRYLLPTYKTESPTRNTEELVRVLDRYKPNLGIVIAFKILPPDVFMYPELGTFNIHASYLPDYRGAAPINWAIINGEDELGLTAFWLDKGIDTGRIIKQRRFNISLDPNLDSYFTFGQAYQTLSENYSPYFCIEVIQMIMNGVKGVIQKVKGDEPKAPKLTRMNTWIDWGECATDVTNFIR